MEKKWELIKRSVFLEVCVIILREVYQNRLGFLGRIFRGAFGFKNLISARFIIEWIIWLKAMYLRDILNRLSRTEYLQNICKNILTSSALAFEFLL